MYGWDRFRRGPRGRSAPHAAKVGNGASPVVIAGRTIATSFWGKAWCDAMESYGDYANRLPRGRTYVRNGSVVDLRITTGLVSASVSGSRLYGTTVRVKPLDPTRWRAVVDRHAAQVSSLVDLLQGKLPASLLHALCDRSSGLFPGPTEIEFDCSCPDWASMCKHVAAVLYGVGARLDSDPGLFFLLRGVDVSDLAARGAAVGFTSVGVDDLVGADLGDIFGIDLGGGPAMPAAGPPTLAVPPTRGSTPKSTRLTPKPTPKPKPKPRAPTPTGSAGKSKRKPVAAAVPITDADLRRLGVDAGTVAEWVRAGVLLQTGTSGVYGITSATGPQLLAHRAVRRS